jgi:hypothetical protein
VNAKGQYERTCVILELAKEAFIRVANIQNLTMSIKILHTAETAQKINGSVLRSDENRWSSPTFQGIRHGD